MSSLINVALDREDGVNYIKSCNRGDCMTKQSERLKSRVEPVRRELVNQALLVCGRVIDGFGDIFFDYANSLWFASQGIAGQSLLGIYQMAQSICVIVIDPVGGVVADRFDRRHILVVADIFSSFVCLAAAACFAMPVFARMLIAANVLLSGASGFYLPAYRSVLPFLVRKSKITSTNSYLELAAQVLSVVAPMLSAVLLVLCHEQGALLVNAASFAIAALLNFMLKPESRDEMPVAGGASLRQLVDDFVEGLRFIKGSSEVFGLLIMSSLVNFFLAGYNLMVPFAQTSFGAGETAYAELLTAASAGGVLGAILTRLLGDRLGGPKGTLFVALFGCGLSLVLLPVSFQALQTYAVVLVCILVFSTLLTFYNVQFFSVLQSSVDEAYLGRTFGCVFVIATLLMPLGTAFFNSLIVVTDVSWYALFGAGVCVSSLFALVLAARSRREG